MNQPQPRRRFLQTAAVACAAPAILTAKRTAAQNVVGSGEHVYQFDHRALQLPDELSWQTTHNVAVDPDNNVYVIHEGKTSLPDHPSIMVFDETGRYIRGFGQQFQGGGHGIEIRVEEGTPYLYVAAYLGIKSIAKMTLDGEVVWERNAPMMSDKYAEGEASDPKNDWGRDHFMPTNFAFLPSDDCCDGDFLLADGYGSYFIHRYSRDGNWMSCFGGPGAGEGTFNLPHGIWIDDRGESASVVIADRAHNALQTFDLQGNYQSTIGGFGLPANMDVRGDWMLVPELVARVSILGPDNEVAATLGDDRERLMADKDKAIRKDESKWIDGKFVHPHDACFDLKGNIYVAEWVQTGRVTKLTPA